MDNPTDSGGTRIPVNIEAEMRESYLAYAMSVIIGRALPDVRDGLKPVHRRVLYAMYEQRNLYNTPYKKSARIVGDVIGEYHPHGDSAVYDTMVRLAQDFSMRYPLVDGQGNFGSIDGDPAAAMRYTEVRMTRLAGELPADIDKRTVDFQENYDGQEQEPTVLPAAFPNLLVNGSGGIAVGMATNMPPHNLQEVIRGVVAAIQRPEITSEELMELIPGPDFPTAGYVYGLDGIRQAYTTGRGIIKMRAKAEVEADDKGEDHAIIVTELPYQVNKARLLQRIAELVRDKKIEGIRDMRDESDRRGMRIYIELKRGVMGQVVLNHLFAMTPMQSSFGIINLAIVHGQPRVLTLRELIGHFIDHRRDVVTRRTRFELEKAQARAHILEGYLIALDAIDEVVELIKKSATPPEAREALMARFSLSEIQAQAILDLRLQRLTGMEVDKIKAEYAELQERMAELRTILGSDARLLEVITEELEALSERYGDPRRTRLVADPGEINMEDLIADEDMVVTVTTTGYIKRTALAEYRTQRRGGRGRSGMNTKEQDDVAHVFSASAHTLLLIFTDRGQVYPLKVWELPEAGINARGNAIVNLIPVESDETIRSIVPVDDLDTDDRWLVFATHQGLVKRTVLSLYKNVRNAGIRAIVLGTEDDLINVALAAPGDHVMLTTARGQAIVFPLDEVRAVGRAAQGVRGMRLRGEDTVVAMELLSADLVAVAVGALDGDGGDDDAEELEQDTALDLADDAEETAEGEEPDEETVDDRSPTVVLVTEHGYGKRTPLGAFRVQHRAGLGLRALPWTARNGDLVAMCRVTPDEDLMVVTDRGMIIRLPVADVRAYSRSARGVRIISLSDDEHVASISTVPGGGDDEDAAEGDAVSGGELQAGDGQADGEGVDGAADSAPVAGDGEAPADSAGDASDTEEDGA